MVIFRARVVGPGGRYYFRDVCEGKCFPLRAYIGPGRPGGTENRRLYGGQPGLEWRDRPRRHQAGVHQSNGVSIVHLPDAGLLGGRPNMPKRDSKGRRLPGAAALRDLQPASAPRRGAGPKLPSGRTRNW